MAIKPRDILATLVQRIEAAHPAPASFGADETDEWPGDVLRALLSQGFLVQAHRADAITCPGCERQCNKRVVVRNTGFTNRAFIMCDEEPAFGRVHVPLSSLVCFESSLRALGLFTAAALGIGPIKPSRQSAAYSLGVVNGRHGIRPVIVAIENREAVLGVGDQRQRMDEVMVWAGGSLALDDKLVHRLANRKVESATARHLKASDRSVQLARKNATHQRDLAILREAKKRHAQGGVTWSRVAGDIAKMKLAQGLSPERVRRIISERRNVERKKSRPNPRPRKQLE